VADILVSKYADHLPLYREAEIYQREGVDLDRSTLAGLGGGSEPEVAASGGWLEEVCAGSGEPARDDVPLLAPGCADSRTL
jgi:transposase